MTWIRIPNRSFLPCSAAIPRTQPIFSSTWTGDSPKVRYTSACLAATRAAAGDEPPK
jgi:hypothetical protein